MTQYNPDRWVVLKMVNKGTTVYKVLGHWRGGYLSGDSWRLNSGITHVESIPGFYRFHGSSGSVYNCHRESYGLSMLTSEIVGRMQERFPDQVEVLDDCDWDLFDFGDTDADHQERVQREV